MDKSRNIEDIYPLSPLQQGLLFHSLRDPEDGAYFLQSGLRIDGLDVEAFQQAWERLVERHSVLRTSFHWEGMDEPLQVVHSKLTVPTTHHDWRGLGEDEQRQRLQAYLAADRRRGFVMSEAPLLRLALFRLNDADYHFVWSRHHISLDGWSGPLVQKELFALYQAFRQGRELDLPTPRPFGDYIAWLQRQDLGQAEAFWRRYLDGFSEPTPVPLDCRGGAGRPRRPEELRFEIPTDVTAALQDLARHGPFTLNTIVQGAWGLVLGRYAGREDVVFGSAFSGRPPELPGVETIVGMFVNMLPVRVRLPAQEPVLTWLKDLQALQTEMTQYQFSPLVQIQGWSKVPRGVPLFDIVFAFENLPTGADQPANTAHRGQARRFHHDLNQTHYPLHLLVGPSKDKLGGILCHAPDRIPRQDAERLLNHFLNALSSIAGNPEQPLDQVSLLDVAERELLMEWNAHRADFPQQRCIHELFEAQAKLAPEAPALVYEDQCWSYAELNARANRLAHHLRDLGVGPETLVGICAERSPEMVMGLLAILKAGGAYLPLDPVYPKERLAFMVQDARVPVLLTQASLVDQLPQDLARIVLLDETGKTSGPAEREENPQSGARPEHLAYVIYTSGSTGRPKGVQVTHDNVGRLFQATQAWFHFDANDTWTLFHSFAFDFSVWEIWGALMHGGRLVLVPYLVSRSPDEFLALLREQRVTVLNQTPSAFRSLIAADQAAGAAPLPSLRLVIFGGEALELNSLRPWFERHGDQCPRLVNMYGITETTVHVTYRPLSSADLAKHSTSVIGWRIPDLELHVLDAHLRRVPIGVEGELYVGGAGLSRGYLNRPQLTAERFLSHPFSDQPGARLYRTGDRVRWLSDGDLAYLGRVDNQIKIRGHRIELGEIEAALLQHPLVRQATVTVQDDPTGNKRLVAYLLSPPPQDITAHLAGSVDAELVSQWQERNDETYARRAEVADPAFNIILDWCQEGLDLATVKQILEDIAPDQLIVQGIPNQRLVTEVKALESLANPQDIRTVGDLLNAVKNHAGTGVDPEEFWSLSDDLPYAVAVRWSRSGTLGHFDVMFHKRPAEPSDLAASPSWPEETKQRKPWPHYANNPGQGVIAAQLTSQVRHFLRERLPEYMMPSAFVFLDRFPLTPNGKVDRKALPAPEEDRPELESVYTAPQTPAEEILAGIWASVLRLERVGVRDNFFELGGDSILSIRVVSSANQAGLSITTRDLFQYPTIQELAARTAHQSHNGFLDQGMVTGPVPLTPIQKWFFELDLRERQHFTQRTTLELPAPVRVDLLEQALGHLVKHHDALRLCFHHENDGWEQHNAGLEASPAPLACIDLSGLSEMEQGPALEARSRELQASLDLGQPPLMRAAWFERGPGRPGLLLLIVHHLAVDVVSWQILREDLMTAYQQLSQGQTVHLPPKTTSFKEWAQRLHEQVRSGALDGEENYWLNPARFEVQPLPIDHPGEANTLDSVDYADVALSAEQTQALLTEVPKAYQTQINDALLTALALALRSWTGQSRVLVDLEGHGREEWIPGVNLTRTVGWFTALFPVLLDLEGVVGPGEALKSVKEQLRAIPHRGIGYGLLRYLSQDQQLTARMKELPAADVVFNYMGHGHMRAGGSSARRAGGVGGRGRGPRHHLLEMNGGIVGQRLEVRIAFSRNLHQPETIQGLAEAFSEALKDLIAHCLSPESGGWTASDFPEADLSQADFEKLMSQVGEAGAK